MPPLSELARLEALQAARSSAGAAAPLRVTPPSRLVRSRRYLEISAILLGWLSWYLTWGYASFVVRRAGTAWTHAWRTGRSGLVGVVITFLLFAAFRRMARLGWSRAAQAAGAVALGLMGAYVHSFVTVTLNRWDWGDRPLVQPPPEYVGGAFAWYIVFASFTLLYFLISIWSELQAERERALRAATLAREARLQMLRYQLNPHFLFNALGTIRSVLYADVTRAERLVTELTEFLRYSLVQEERLEVTLGQELDTIQNYLSIQQMRFEEKLRTYIVADEAARSWTIPAFLVHPLVENAVKHGMRTSAMPLSVGLEACVQDGSLVVDVSNTGSLRHSPGRMLPLGGDTGIGLKNVRMQLEHFFPDRHTFTLEERDGIVHASLIIRPEPVHAS